MLPLATWLAAGTGALLGFAMLMPTLPGLDDTLVRLALAGAAAASVGVRGQDRLIRRSASMVALLLLTVSAHVAFKQLFALSDAARFVRFGLAERTLWGAALGGIALATWQRRPRIARGFALANLAHGLYFTMLLHDPLWARQAIGSWPLFNMLLPAYGLAFAWTWAAPRFGLPHRAERARGWLAGNSAHLAVRGVHATPASARIDARQRRHRT